MKHQPKSGTPRSKRAQKVAQVPAVVRKLQAENAELRENLGHAKDMLFAIGRQYGRIRLTAENAEGIDPSDELDVKRDGESGDFLITYKPRANEVQQAKGDVVSLRGGA